MVHGWFRQRLESNTISGERYVHQEITEREMLMQFSIGDKIVHPYRGPGRVVDVERKEFMEEEKRYYVIEYPAFHMTMHVPVRKSAELGMRPAMSQAKIARVLETLRRKPHRLPEDYKKRQENVSEKINAGRPIITAEAVRDLTWHRQRAHLTKKDSELLQRGQDFLAAEMALVSDSDVSEANERIESVLAAALAGWKLQQSSQAS
jgi:CarD family transcriptional regulator